MKIFVYGTLKRGFRNAHYLKNARYLSQDITRHPVFEMKEKASKQKPGSTYPAIFENGTSKINGEVYEITSEILKELDILEEINVRYIRKLIELEKSGAVQAYISIDIENFMAHPENIDKIDNIYTFTNRN